MRVIRAFMKAHPVLTFFVLTLTLSWGGFVLVIGGPGAFPATSEQIDRLMPAAMSVFEAGPAIAGILLTGLIYGRGGFRELLSRLLRWRVDARWYAVALLAAPLVFAAVHFALSLLSPAYLPAIVTTDDKVSLLLTGIAVGLVGGGILEELGWTGFAVPRLGKGVLPTGLVVGMMWGAWHFLVYFFGAGTWAGGLPLALFLAGQAFSLLVGQLTAYRVLMVWVYDRTESLLVAILMHASLTACTFVLGPGLEAFSGVTFLTYGFVLALAWWVVVAAVALVTGGRLKPLRVGVDPQAR